MDLSPLGTEMKDWKKGLHKLMVLAYMNVPVSREFYNEFNHCYRCKNWGKKLSTYNNSREEVCFKKSPQNQSLTIKIIGFMDYFVCLDWEPKRSE